MALADLVADMAGIAGRFGPPSTRGGRAVQFLALRSGDGVSTLARAFAQAVSGAAQKGVWLVELDVLADAQARAIAEQPDVFGPLGPAVRASPDGSSFFKVTGAVGGARTAAGGYLMAHAVGPRRLWVTRFRPGALQPGQSIEMQDTDDYWRALREHADWIVVDAPALDRSEAGLVTARRMDANILVLNAAKADPQADLALRDAVRRSGGAIAGAYLTHAPSQFLTIRPSVAGRRRR